MSPGPAGWWSRPALPGRARQAILLPVGATFALMFGAGQLGWRSLLLPACLTAAPVAVAVLSRPDLGSLRVLSRMPPRATVGETVDHGLVVRNSGRGWSPPLTLLSEVPGFAPLQVAVPALAPGDNAVLETPRTAVARAASSRHLTRVRTTEPFGLIEREVTAAQDQQCLVHPAPAAAVPVHPGGDGDDRDPGVPDRAGTQPHGVREWRPGDSFRGVHWRSTARHGRLVVVEPERPRGRRVAVLVAGPAQDGQPGYESVLARAAATAVQALADGDEVLLAALGPVGPALVPQDPTSALDWFALLRPPHAPDVIAPATDPARLLARLRGWLGPGGALVVAAAEPVDLPEPEAASGPATAPVLILPERGPGWPG